MKNQNSILKNIILSVVSVLAVAGMVSCKTSDFTVSIKDTVSHMRLPAGQNVGTPVVAADNTTAVSLFFGENINSRIKGRVVQLMSAGLKNISYTEKCSADKPRVEFHFGNTEASQALIAKEEKAALHNEGFIIRTKKDENCLVVAVDGKSAASIANVKAQRGLSFGVYAVLQDIGFRFLNPLLPTIDKLNMDIAKLNIPSRVENPRWDVRAIHLHTMHPLEITNLVNGWGVKGATDAEGWASMFPYWSSYMEWLLAHKQNEVEWMLLWDPEVGSFNQSDIRQKRLTQLNHEAHAWGIETGIVTPLRFVQQNGWTLLRNHKPREGQPSEKQENLKEIKANLDWLLAADFDSIGGELGEGEFSSAPPQATIDELNGIADYLSSKKVPYRVKIHVSTKQYAKGFIDPGTGKDINFNYLPLYANSHVGVLPHTIQIYSLDDPAPTYGNKNFMDMFRFIKMAASGTIGGKKREVLFYPETSYWVSYDNDVPLFLPVYPYRRVHDLRLIAKDETSGEMKKTKSHIDGQVIFASGWEWGYWFNDMISAEAAWNPEEKAPTSLEAYRRIISKTLRLPLHSEFVSSLVQMADSQHKILVLGKLKNGVSPATIAQRSGIAYLSGVDVWDELGMLAHHPSVKGLPGADKIPLTQPSKYPVDWAFHVAGDIGKLLFPDWSKVIPPILGGKNGPDIPPDVETHLTEKVYDSDIKPLFNDMNSALLADWQRLAKIKSETLPEGLRFYAHEFTQGAEMTYLRAFFVAKIYEGRLARHKQKQPDLVGLQSILNRAKAIAVSRLSQSTMKVEHRSLISKWESPQMNNPTDYHFGYLWSAYNLFYWQREFNKIADKNPKGSVCYMNITKVSDLEGKPGSTVSSVENIGRMFGSTEGCTTVPSSEPNLETGW